MSSIKIGGYKKTNRQFILGSSAERCSEITLGQQLPLLCVGTTQTTFWTARQRSEEGSKTRHSLLLPVSFFSAFYLLWKGTGRGRQQREKELNYYMRHALRYQLVRTLHLLEPVSANSLQAVAYSYHLYVNLTRTYLSTDTTNMLYMINLLSNCMQPVS